MWTRNFRIRKLQTFMMVVIILLCALMMGAASSIPEYNDRIMAYARYVEGSRKTARDLKTPLSILYQYKVFLY